MSIYLINIVLILFWNGIISNDNKNKKKIICILCCIQWIIISGLRAYTVGNDTDGYRLTYIQSVNTSWSKIFKEIVTYFSNFKKYKDPGYSLIEKICCLIFRKNYTLYLIFIASFFTIPMTVWIYKSSKNVTLSFMIYSALFYSFFAITGLRQTIATALVLFFGYECMKKGKVFLMIICQLIAFFIHKSSVCFMIIYFARFIKLNNVFWIVSTIAIILSFVFKDNISKFISGVLGYESYAEYFEGAGAYKFTVFLTAIYLIVMFLYGRLDDDYDTKHEVFGLVISMFLLPLTFINPSNMRAVQYFSVFIMILVPRVVSSFDFKTEVIANSFCYIVLIASVFIANPTYSFVFM